MSGTCAAQPRDLWLSLPTSVGSVHLSSSSRPPMTFSVSYLSSLLCARVQGALHGCGLSMPLPAEPPSALVTVGAKGKRNTACAALAELAPTTPSDPTLSSLCLAHRAYCRDFLQYLKNLKPLPLAPLSSCFPPPRMFSQHFRPLACSVSAQCHLPTHCVVTRPSVSLTPRNSPVTALALLLTVCYVSP